MTAKLKIVEADDENKSITFLGLEGDILKVYRVSRRNSKLSKQLVMVGA